MTVGAPPVAPRRSVVAVDGPAAAGKGTLARRLARELGVPYLDTGALYRAVGRRVLDEGADPSDPVAAEAAARSLRTEDLHHPRLRARDADAAASRVAALPGVRAALLDFQRNFAVRNGAVLDGRDIGTVVFPDAAAKLFVTASLEERARRRFRERAERGEAVSFEAVSAEMAERDARDAHRDAAPMTPAPDAALLDTTRMDPDTVFAAALEIVRAKLPAA